MGNETIAILAHQENLAPIENAKQPYAKAFEVEIARRYYSEGFRETRHWLFGLFDKYVDLKKEIAALRKRAA